MFKDKLIYGRGDYAENHSRVYYDAAADDIGLDFINTETGVLDGSQGLSPEEAENLGWALIEASMAVARERRMRAGLG